MAEQDYGPARPWSVLLSYTRRRRRGEGEEEEGKLIDKITRMNLRRTVLSEKNPFRKVTYYTIPFTERS